MSSIAEHHRDDTNPIQPLDEQQIEHLEREFPAASGALSPLNSWVQAISRNALASDSNRGLAPRG